MTADVRAALLPWSMTTGKGLRPKLQAMLWGPSAGEPTDFGGAFGLGGSRGWGGILAPPCCLGACRADEMLALPSCPKEQPQLLPASGREVNPLVFFGAVFSKGLKGPGAAPVPLAKALELQGMREM